MAIRSRKPTSPGRRFQTSSDFGEITSTKPEKSLLAKKSKTGGRNSYGRKTSRHRGGGHKQQYRIIDFTRVKDDVPAKVASIEYDPNRTCRIALLHYNDGEKAYILAPRGLSVGDTVQSGHGADIRPGNAMPLRFIPVGTVVHNVELRPGGGGKIGRAAGIAVQLVAKDGDYARRGRQRRARTREDRQGRPQPLEGRPSPDPWRGHEPRRPPTRWWRGPYVRWPPRRVAVGPARRPHPQQEEVQPAAHHPSSSLRPGPSLIPR